MVGALIPCQRGEEKICEDITHNLAFALCSPRSLVLACILRSLVLDLGPLSRSWSLMVTFFLVWSLPTVVLFTRAIIALVGICVPSSSGVGPLPSLMLGSLPLILAPDRDPFLPLMIVING